MSFPATRLVYRLKRAMDALCCNCLSMLVRQLTGEKGLVSIRAP